jgi:hypothetical protein
VEHREPSFPVVFASSLHTGAEEGSRLQSPTPRVTNLPGQNN